jgi:dihydroflavonol-4-reductase
MLVLVTGAGGFIGSHVVRQSLAAGHRVRALHLPGENLANLAGLDVELIPGDVRDRACLERAVADCERVFHLAAVYALWLPRPQTMWEVNVDGTRNVLEAARQARVDRVVVTSSIAVFGGQGLGQQASEKSPFRLAQTGDLYSLTKYESHRVAEEYADRGLHVSIVAPTGPLGPGDIAPTPTGRLLLSALNLPFAITTKSMTNVVDVRDVAQGHLLAAERGRPGESYLLGSDDLSFSDLVRRFLVLAGSQKRIIEVPYPLLELAGRSLLAYSRLISQRPPLLTPAGVRIAKLGLRADCSKARRELGLRTRPLDETISDAIAYFAKRGLIGSKRRQCVAPAT